MRLVHNEIEEPDAPAAAWARAGVVLTAVATVALAVALMVVVVRATLAGR
ncbi:MAG TPA: hypothetical protein VN193_04695 [Candidatus Angelobacter sp.]|jgi:hypothetical protein|nr:hypothetical protein [Candidatus Angelobacter sp.]